MTAHRPEHLTKTGELFFFWFMEPVKVRWEEAQRGRGGGMERFSTPPRRLEGVRSWLVCTGTKREDLHAKYLRCSSRERFHWGHKTEPGWSNQESDFRNLKRYLNVREKSRKLHYKDVKGQFELSGFGGCAPPVGRDMGPEPQEETDTSKASEGSVLRWGAFPQGPGGQSDQPRRGAESQAGGRLDEHREADNGPGQAKPAARSPSHRGGEQVLGDKQPSGDHAASNPPVCYSDNVRWASARMNSKPVHVLLMSTSHILLKLLGKVDFVQCKVTV